MEKGESSLTFLPFSAWMERALFAPQTGYYSARIKTVGRRGDFSTSATTDGILGRAIAAWIKRDLKDCRCVIEVGGGDGSLSSQVRSALGWWTGRQINWRMVEKSPILRAQQVNKLNRWKTTWHEEMVDALKACDGHALIFHNELVDAFPVNLMQWDAEAKLWQEVWLEQTEAGWHEKLVAHKLPDTEFSALGDWSKFQVIRAPRQRIELGEAYRCWLDSWAGLWKQGSMLTIDYGDLFPAVYFRRPYGTLRSYLLHQVGTGKSIYENMGRQDITADVNFSDVINWGKNFGWINESLLTQTHFIQQYLPEQQTTRGAGFLVDEDGAGSAFKVLIQRTGVDQNRLRP